MADRTQLDGAGITGPATPTPATVDKEAPEADALEQAVPAAPDDEFEMVEVSGDPEAPEADTIEQARVVVFDEE